MYEDDDDEQLFLGLYNDGKWTWDNKSNELVFVSNAPQETIPSYLPAVAIQPLDFRDDMDVLEQQKFRKRYQRKKLEGKVDVVTLQDVKDLVLYTAPAQLLCPAIINVMHTVTIDRFLRALILYCHFYAQIAEIMSARAKELETKIHTEKGDEIESTYRENLTDIRLLVTKEYCNMILGVGDFQRFHHKGKAKKSKSKSGLDAKLYESLLRLCVRIVWIALARRNYQQIELEINRIIRSSKFNTEEHRNQIYADSMLTERERSVLRGNCVGTENYLKAHSPLYDEICCEKEIDFRLLGLGSLKMKELNPRLKYFENYLTLREEQFERENITLGIIGLRRDRFDTLLKEIPKENEGSERRSSTQSVRSTQSLSTLRRGSSRALRASFSSVKKLPLVQQPLIEEITLPDKTLEPLPPEFPANSLRPLPVNKVQYRRWLARVTRKPK